MINANSGSLKFDNYHLVIHPELSLSDFRSGDIEVVNKMEEKKYSARYCFKATLDKMAIISWVDFKYERLHRLTFKEDVDLLNLDLLRQKRLAAQKAGGDFYISELNKSRMFIRQYQINRLNWYNAWLENVIGKPPPYEYENWGEIGACIDEREEDVEILFRFRCDYGEDVDLKEFFQKRRDTRPQQFMNYNKPFVRGKLPPGFSPKSKPTI